MNPNDPFDDEGDEMDPFNKFIVGVIVIILLIFFSQTPACKKQSHEHHPVDPSLPQEQAR